MIKVVVWLRRGGGCFPLPGRVQMKPRGRISATAAADGMAGRQAGRQAGRDFKAEKDKSVAKTLPVRRSRWRRVLRWFCSTFIQSRLLQHIPGDGGGKAGERDGWIDGRPVERHSSPHWAEKKEILLTCRGATTQLFGNVRQQMANSKRPSRSEKGEGKGERRRKPLATRRPHFPFFLAQR